MTVGVIPHVEISISANRNFIPEKKNYLHNSLLCDKFVYYDEMFLFRLIEPIFPKKIFFLKQNKINPQIEQPELSSHHHITQRICNYGRYIALANFGLALLCP